MAKTRTCIFLSTSSINCSRRYPNHTNTKEILHIHKRHLGNETGTHGMTWPPMGCQLLAPIYPAHTDKPQTKLSIISPHPAPPSQLNIAITIQLTSKHRKSAAIASTTSSASTPALEHHQSHRSQTQWAETSIPRLTTSLSRMATSSDVSLKTAAARPSKPAWISTTTSATLTVRAPSSLPSRPFF